jgi:hypothetical protein
MITRLPKVYGSSCPRLDWIRSDTCAAKVRVWKHVEPFISHIFKQALPALPVMSSGACTVVE